MRPLLDCQQTSDLVAEIDPVGKLGEFVVPRQMADLGFGIAPLGDVFEQHDRAAAGHRLEGPGQRAVSGEVGIGGDDVPGLRILDFGQDHPAAHGRDRSGTNAGRDDVGGGRAALHEIVRQIHHIAETMIHHREPSVGAEHAEPVRHVVERRIELSGQRRFSEARRQRLDENGMQAEVDALQADEEQHQQHGQPDVVEAAMQRQRQRHRPAGQQDVILDQLRAAVIACRAASSVTDSHGDAQHVGDRIVVAINGDEGPDAEHRSVEHGADRVAWLPVLRLLERQHRGAPLVFAHLESAHRADADDQNRAWPQENVAGFERCQ